MTNSKLIGKVCPVSQEVGNLEKLVGEKLNAVIALSDNLEMDFAVDRSINGTERFIRYLQKVDLRIKVGHFLRGFGQPEVVLTGLDNATGESAMVMYADLHFGTYIMNLTTPRIR